MEFIFLLIIGVLTFIIASHFANNNASKIEGDERAKLLEIYKGYNNYLDINNFTVNKRIKLQRSPGDLPSQEVAFDIENQKIFIFKSEAKPFIINFSELVRCDVEIEKSPLLKNDKIRNAVIGGLIAGPTGALIGSETTQVNEIVTSVYIKIVTTDIENPIITLLPFYDSSQSSKPEEIGNALHFSSQIQATLEGILHTNKSNNANKNNM